MLMEELIALYKLKLLIFNGVPGFYKCFSQRTKGKLLSSGKGQAASLVLNKLFSFVLRLLFGNCGSIHDEVYQPLF